MPLSLHRSNRVESLVAMLCAQLSVRWPEDPFDRVPIVVGSGGMERFLRHEIATRTGIASGLAFPFPRPAFLGAASWLLAGAADLRAEFWKPGPESQQAAARFEREGMTFRIVELLRAHREAEGFEHVRRYLGPHVAADGQNVAVSARELMFARDVADVLDRMMHDRPDDALGWAREPSSARDDGHLWIARLLGELGAASDDTSPARSFEALRRAALPATGRMLCVFGLSTLGPGDRARLSLIARGIDLHLFVMAPTRQWFVDQRTRDEHRRALRDAKTPEDIAQLEFDQRHENPVVAALGVPSRDLQNWLEEVGYAHDEESFEVPSAASEPLLLERVQGWMLDAQGLADVHGAWALDNSIQFHASYGALRQCEILRDTLLQLFAQDPSLEPRDVLVMTPDIETFAPLVAAVFARHGGALKPGASEDSSPGASVLPAIPTSIADLGLSRTNPMAEVLLTLLRLAGERVTATRVFSLLSLQPVRFRFGIGDDDLGALQDLIRASGLRWGLDADDRSAAGQPRSDQNTLRFAAERLALGVLMADEDPLGVVQGEDTNLGPSVPLDAQGTQAVDHAGTLLTLLRVLRVHRAALAGPASIAAWRGCLLQALDALADTSDSSAWLRSEVVDALDVLAQQAAPLGDVAVERAALVKWLAGGFEVSQRGDRPITGAVTVCALQPMRSVPFRVVALLGMDDKAFPRGGRAKTWDPFERRRAGERDGRETDRHLLLEAMLSARERLLLFWSGHGVDNGKAQAAAVPVEELLEVVGALTVRKRAALVQEHPLQPWSEGNFAPDATSHDAALASAAEQLRELRAGSREPARPNFFRDRSVTLPEEPEPIRVLSVDDLAWALYGPQKVLLKDRLGLTVTVGNDGLEDREPLDLEGIDNDAITLRVLTALQAGASAMQPTQLAARLGARLAGEGHRPLRPDVAAVLQTRVDSAHETRAQAEGVRGTPHGPLELAWTGRGGLQLVGRVADVRAHEGRLLLQWTTTYSAASAPSQLAAFAHLLVAHAMRLPVIGARILSPGMPATPGHAAGVFLALPSDVHGTPEVAALLLDDLMAIYASMRRRALPLFPRTSLNVAMVLHASDDDLDAPGTLDRLRAEAENAWAGRPPKLRGDGQDPWIARIFDGYDPCNDLSPSADGLLDLARRVWLPILRAHDAGDALSTMLAPISTPEGVPG